MARCLCSVAPKGHRAPRSAPPPGAPRGLPLPVPAAPASSPLRRGLVGGLAALLTLSAPGASLAQEAATMPSFSGADDASSALVQGLLAKSRENKAANDQERLDRYYKRDWMVNRIAGSEVLPEPCDPRDPEFGTDPKCVKLPRLPQDRVMQTGPSTEDFAGIDGRARLRPPIPEPDF